jgi:hypothetical protein
MAVDARNGDVGFLGQFSHFQARPQPQCFEGYWNDRFPCYRVLSVILMIVYHRNLAKSRVKTSFVSSFFFSEGLPGFHAYP